MRGLVSLAVALTLLAGTPACSEEQPKKPDARPPTGARGLERGAAPLVQALRAVARRCQVLEQTGQVSRCPDDEDRLLRQQELAAGPRAALATYCHGLGETDPRLRALCGRGLARLAHHRIATEVRDPKILSCLLGELDGLKDPRIARPLARATAYLATALRRETRLLPLLQRAKLPAVAEAGHGALWALGRLRLLPHLERVIKSDKQPEAVRVAAIRGFTVGAALRPAERTRVCDVLAPLLGASPLAVASAAARCAAEQCPALRKRVLTAAESLHQKQRLDAEFIAAVRATETEKAAARRERVLALLTAVVGDARYPAATRAAALRKVSWIERSTAVRLARAHKEQPGALGHAAADLLQGR